MSVFLVKFRSERGDAIRGMRATLKFALRNFGLKCAAIVEVSDPPDNPAPPAPQSGVNTTEEKRR